MNRIVFQRAPDLWIALGCFALLGVLLLIPAEIALLRAVVAIPCVLVLPGYMLLAALQPQTTNLGLQRLLMSVAVSLAVLVLGGLLLNLLPWGITRGAWFVLLMLLTLGCGIVAVRRRVVPLTPGGPVEPIGGALITIALLVMVSAVALAAASDRNQPDAHFTQLWATNAPAGGFELGVANQERTPVTYRVAVVAPDGAMLQQWENVELRPGQTWQVALAPPTGRAEVQLFRDDAPDTVYRRVALQPGE